MLGELIGRAAFHNMKAARCYPQETALENLFSGPFEGVVKNIALTQAGAEV